MYASVLVLLVINIVTSHSASLPSYINKCSLKDQRLGECLTRNANLAIPKIAKGDIHYDIPPLSPLEIASTLVIKNDKDLKFVIHNPQVFGLEDTLVSTMTFDGKKVHSVFINPSIRILAKYELLGTLLNQTVFGNGLANITLDRGIYKYNMSLQTRNNFGDFYFDLKAPTFSYETIQTIYCFDDLYNGSKFLGAQMNNLINKNWLQVQQIFQPTATRIMRDATSQVMNGIFQNVPVAEIFKP